MRASPGHDGGHVPRAGLLAVVSAALAPRPGRRRRRAPDQAGAGQAEHGRADERRPDGRVAPRDGELARAARGAREPPSRTTSRRSRSAAPRARRSSPASTPTTTPSWATRRRPAATRSSIDHTNTLPAWLQRAGYRTVHIGKYLNGYGPARPTEIPPGWTEWYGSTDPSTYQFYNYTPERERPDRDGTGPARRYYQADVYTRKAVDAVRRLAPGGAVLPLRRLPCAAQRRAARVGRPRQPGHAGRPRRGTGTASRPSRCRSRRPSTRRTSSDKPPGIRNAPLIGPARVTAIPRSTSSGSSRCSPSTKRSARSSPRSRDG